MLLNRTVESLMREGKNIASKGGIVTRKTALLPYVPGSEWELEATLDRMVAKGSLTTPAYEDIRSRKIVRSKRCFVILADKSNSLGPTIDYVALAVSILAEALRNEDYAVVLFDDRIREVKAVGDFKEESDVLEEILNVECSGATNLHAAFEEVSRQFASASSGAEGICVVVSDVIPTVGPDPLEAASTLPQMEVLYFPNNSTAIGETCADDLEALPRVRVREIRELGDIVDAIQDIISFGSLEVAHG
ncbi:MAG: VWA domain-containing protein [Alphaproteobacteria bacterium]|uniref:VWA domain-containing protein n=1 Tax=Candidatus Nitrobium versatile TaxID=2884831 RepID=A0A953SF96_9BACT|nr:VWA domain-containing protein [Candidatus Nitrobium versatile]